MGMRASFPGKLWSRRPYSRASGRNSKSKEGAAGVWKNAKSP